MARITPDYFVVMIDYGNKGREAVVDPELTRANVVERLRSGEYQNVEFVHHIADGLVEDVTHEMIEAAEQAARESEFAAIRRHREAA